MGLNIGRIIEREILVSLKVGGTVKGSDECAI